MAFGVTFKRYEKKFLLNPEQFLIIKAEIDKYFEPDKFGETKICNLYYDTSDFVLIRRSVDKPIFKEKLRLRTYGVPNDSTTAFVEVKRKFNKVVYKRRMHLTYEEALKYTACELKVENQTQITKEIDYFLKFYKGIAPQFYISYDRSAFFYKETSDIRVTFDRNITWRDYDLDLRVFPDGAFKILDRGEYNYHKNKMGYSDEIDMILKSELSALIEMARKNDGPFKKGMVENYYPIYKKYKMQQTTK